ncbi:bifunctional glycosyltransferase family 2 protein/CDP-glycerol:glycerophosphate glycerophosphotransferase [Streptomyces sp. N2-109]|uniref:Bifunctional glycosyltransferase family 2 protein/CDP-glycerol:glycerophosphate glycerophosphotransferase n=1 Tax=Streptomyces gossypii TaxID=2883101 RepID=A0ABT2JU09_9ACTN|nr:bifunctional glycosyltransferase family 2 protein/CDP-glycerol:glycerophosphate glycerophosphotransferase [Streptomyces gossypii]MCT2591316.1 bifunctional glycosyltransferase family 2 protein/CDP-glycerol:glycerophosphate glycerophosphotransferase [Streptomyces gossypii]
MPRLSVIVPVFKVQGYLRECLDSIVGQSFTDVEIIAVDDHSPDGCGRILDEYAAREPRFTVLHLPSNVGLGRARNAGAAQARGDYLLFLDSDDSYLEGALEAVAAQLEACGEPDVLVFDHVRSYWWNGVRPSVFGEQLAAPGTGTASAFENPDLLRLFAVAWNKAYRREFYQHHAFAFEPGLYEDAPLAYEVMISARSIGCLPRACVSYRQRPQGAITRSPGRKHFDIFPQYESLFAFLDARPELDELRPVLFERMISHYLFCVARPDRVRPSDRRAYFRAAARHYHRFRPTGFRPPGGIEGAAFRLLASRSYTAYATLENAKRGRRSLLKRARRGRHALGRPAYRMYYRLQRRLPLDKRLAVYSAYWDRGVTCNPAAVQRKCAELVPQIHGVWVVRRSAVPDLPPGTDYVLPRSRRYWQLMARATYFVNNVNFPDTVVKRRGQIHLQTHHGTPLKRMGLDQQPHPAAGMDFRGLLRRAARWDFSISANPHSTEVWDRVYPSAYEHLESGYPRNDVLSTATGQDVLAARDALGIPQDRIALLYLPTMRDYRKGFVPLADLGQLSRQLGEDFVLLVRTHYFYGDDRALLELHERGLLVDVSRHPSVEQLSLASDALITDYSSVMFDYAALDRPMVIYAPDWAAYRASRGVYFDLLSGRPGETPGALARTEDELARVFTSGAWRGPEAEELRRAFRERFSTYDDGYAAERVVRRVFLGEDVAALPPVVPMADRHPAPPARQAEPPPPPKVPLRSLP